MNLPARKSLDHRGPLSIDVVGAWYFITICATERIDYRAVGGGTPTLPEGNGRDGVPSPSAASATISVGGGTPTLPGVFMPVAREMLECAREYHLRGKWQLALFFVMPDHLHFIVHIPARADGDGTPSLPHVLQHWKHYVSEHLRVGFQKDFWDTRLRDATHYAEKFRYVCNNPVRKGLCAMARDWPYVIAFDRETGEERVHRGAVGGGTPTLPEVG